MYFSTYVTYFEWGYVYKSHETVVIRIGAQRV